MGFRAGVGRGALVMAISDGENGNGGMETKRVLATGGREREVEVGTMADIPACRNTRSSRQRHCELDGTCTTAE